jgi:hypothetical protein
VLIEAKDDVLATPPGLPPLTRPEPFGSQALQEIDDTIRSVFPAGQMITPDDVRGRSQSLEAAVLLDGWPALSQSRGRVLFALDNTDGKRESYIAGHPSLAGRVLFTNSQPGTPEAAFIEVDDPLTDGAYIRQLVRKGYLVRTRADADTGEARSGSTARRDAALASGAHYVSTDFPEPDARFSSGYAVRFPENKVARCNPVLSSPACAVELALLYP